MKLPGALDQCVNDDYGWYRGDSCEMIKGLPDDSVGLSVFSPPFPGMYAYTNTPRDIGNCKNIEELLNHFSFMMGDILRATMPGRSCAIHLTQEPVFKGMDGHVGLRDFRGKTIDAMERNGWQWFGECTIDKDPQLKATRTKDHSLLFKTIGTDSSCNRMAMADYLLQFRKPGDNPQPIKSGTHPRWNPKGGWITSEEWCEWAAPVWYRSLSEAHEARFPDYPGIQRNTSGIRETDVLRTKTAKDQDDEKHLCPLQLGVIERCVKLWSNPRDIVFSPFGGIGSEGYVSLKNNRRFVGFELKDTYWAVGKQNLDMAITERDNTGAQKTLIEV